MRKEEIAYLKRRNRSHISHNISIWSKMLGNLLQTGEMKCHSILFTNFPTISNHEETDKSRSFSTFTLFYKRATPHALVHP